MFDWYSNPADTIAFDPALSLLSFLEGFRTGKRICTVLQSLWKPTNSPCA